MKKLLLLALLFCNPLHSLVILVHGTFRDPYYIIQRWINPNGEFYKQISEQAQALGHDMHIYKWSGHNNNNARIEGAFGLARFLLTTPGDSHILIGHSHGGNVIALASEILALLETTPNAEKIADVIAGRMAKTRGPIFERTNFSFKRTKKKIKKLAQNLLDLPRPEKKAKKIIETAFLSGNPICDWYQPSGETINRVISLYSFGDNIQLLVGNRVFAEKPHITNIRTIINGANPSHRSLSSPIIAKWLLTLRTADLKSDMVVHFSRDKAPVLNVCSPNENISWYKKAQKAFKNLFSKTKPSN